MTSLKVMLRAAAGFLTALVVAASAVSCTGGGHGGGPPGASSSAASSSPASGGPGLPPEVTPGTRPATLAGFYAQHLSWTSCDSGFECARFYVPFDYARPDGPVFSLPVIKLPAAKPAQRVGPLVINPGGPGGSGLQYVLNARSGEFSQAVRDRFDILGFDPRGVGASVPALRCTTGPQLDKYLAVNESPASAAQLAAVVAANKGYAAACARNARSLLPYIGTADAARDMDILRAALGESRLTFLGKSYGTVLGASYAQQFPARVRALVLDGAVAPGLSGVDFDIAQASGFQVAFGQFATWCVTQPRCPLPTALPAAVAKVSGLVSAANARPLASELSGDQPADGAMLLLGIAAALYSRSLWPVLRDVLSQAFKGDGTVLVELADSLEQRSPNGSYSNLADVSVAVECVDRVWPHSIAAWQAAAASAAKVSPLFGPTLVWGSLPCAYWPVRASPVLSGASRPAPSVLVVGDLHDPATPYGWAQALARWLRPGVLLGWNGEGHTSYMQGSSCVDAAVDAYLISLRAPGNGTICP
jgi:pimeloyl-ACP methyl ester carboxylesterase